MPRISRRSLEVRAFQSIIIALVAVKMNAHFKWLTTNAFKVDASLLSLSHLYSLGAHLLLSSKFTASSVCGPIWAIKCSYIVMLVQFIQWLASFIFDQHPLHRRRKFLLAIICACAIYSNELYRDFKMFYNCKKGKLSHPFSLRISTQYGKTWFIAVCNLC